MTKFYIEISKDEVRLYDPTGIVFFILKENNGTYYTSNIFKYDIIVNELRDWTIQIFKENKKGTFPLSSFSYDEIIKPMFTSYTREEKLNELLKK